MRLISLIGEQPIPNLLPIRYLSPWENLLVYTQRTRHVAERLRGMISPGSGLDGDLIIEDPYDLQAVLTALRTVLENADNPVVNLTGGTKIMSLAAYQAARETQAEAVYLISEGKASLLSRYIYTAGQHRQIEQVVLGPLISIDDYLLVHGLVPSAARWPQNSQEAGLRRWLAEQVDECRTNLVFEGFEIDFILRRGNQVAIVEAKDTRENKRTGIDQLNTAGGRAYLGTYTGKILLVPRPLGPQLSHLAQARQVQVAVIEGTIDPRTGRLVLSTASRQRLLNLLEEVLGPPVSRTPSYEVMYTP